MSSKLEDVSVEQIRDRLKSLTLRAEQIIVPEIKNNEILSRFFQILKSTDYNTNLFEIAAQHLKTITTINLRSSSDMKEIMGSPVSYENIKFLTEEECVAYYTAKLFLDKMQLMKSVPHPAFFDYSGPIDVLPLQYFLKGSTNEQAKHKFENSLKTGDLLFVEMMETECKGLHKPELAKLRIIARVSDSFDIQRDFVYHLDSVVYMFKNLEMERLGRNEIKSSEVLKVGILGQPPTPNKRFVTTNVIPVRRSQSEKISLKLGFVPFDDMPPFLKAFKSTQKFSCYSNYLRHQPQFFHSTEFTKMMESLGIDPFRIYSFCTNRDGLTVPPGRSTDSLVRNAKEAIHNDAQNHLAVARKYLQKDEFENAIQEFECSAKCWPENYKVYELRGKMYLSMSTKRTRRGSFLKKALVDFETALALNPSAKESKESLSKIFVYLSKRLIKNRELSKALEYLSTALKICPENKDASALQKRIETRKKALDAMDLQTLERHKEILQKEIKKEKL